MASSQVDICIETAMAVHAPYMRESECVGS
jgi:hypothetical protein